MKVLVGSLKNKYCSDNAVSISDTALFSCDENSLLEINLLNKAEKTVYGAIVKVISFNAQGETVKQNIIRQDNIGLSAGQTMAVSVVLPKDTEYGVVYVQTIVFDDLAADLTPRTANKYVFKRNSNISEYDRYLNFNECTVSGIRGYSVSLGYNDSPKNLEIPSRYNGKPVLKIDSSAFNGCKSLLSVILPNTIVYISEYAFAHCTNLTRIDIKSGIISIGNYAFYCCDGLTSINLPDSLTSIGTDIFANCVSLENVTLPSGITSIKVREFSNCINLTSIFIPKNVTTIADGAFNNCYNIQTVYYGGTSNEWFNITIGIYNEYIINANLICSKDSELSRHTTANEYFNFTLLSGRLVFNNGKRRK